jgi:hypothetical protein
MRRLIRERNAQFLESASANVCRVPFAISGDFNNLFGNDFSDGVGTIGEPKQAQRRFIGGRHSPDIVRRKSGLLQETMNCHLSRPHPAADSLPGFNRLASPRCTQSPIARDEDNIPVEYDIFRYVGNRSYYDMLNY